MNSKKVKTRHPAHENASSSCCLLLSFVAVAIYDTHIIHTADEIVGDVIDILVALTDFREFKDMMVAHRKGRDNGLALAAATAAVATGIEPRGGHATRDEAGPPAAAAAGAGGDFHAQQQQSGGFVAGTTSATDAPSMGGRAKGGRGIGEAKR